MQRLEARLVATATATFHFISFMRLVPFRFSGFAEWLRGAVAEIRNRIKMRQRLERQLCGNEIQMYLGLPLTDCLSLALLGVAHLPVACRMCRLVRDAFISYISFHAVCVCDTKFNSVSCVLCVCVCVYLYLLIDMRLFFFFFLFAVNWIDSECSRVSSNPQHPQHTILNTIQHD